MNLEILPADLVMRIAWTIGIILFGLSLYWLTNRLILVRARGRAQGLESIQHDGPTLIYFTSPTCAPCKTIQRPAIDQVKQKIGEYLQVIEVDTSARPDIAGYWGVLSVPTTLVIDSRGQARHVNHGVTKADKLIRQIEAINL